MIVNKIDLINCFSIDFFPINTIKIYCVTARIRNIISNYSRVTNLPTHKTVLKIGKDLIDAITIYFTRQTPEGPLFTRILASIVCF